MLPAIWIAARAYVPYITFPVAAIIGFIGYHFESLVSDKHTPANQLSTEVTREERRLHEVLNSSDIKVESLKDRRLPPMDALRKNLSTSTNK